MPGTEDIERAIRRLTRRRVYVGIPQEKDPRQDSPIGNASLAYIFNFGSPARNIPARPHAIPGIEAAGPEIEGFLRLAALAALDGDMAAVDKWLGNAGQAGVNSITRMIQAGIPPPLAEKTVAARRRRTPGSSYRRKAERSSDVTPLIDTGDYLRAWTWVIRDV